MVFLEIAPGIQHTDWLRLNLKDDSIKDWKYAINILKKRIENRYIEPIDILLAIEKKIQPKYRKYGFTILAIDCLLIETLHAFIKGWESTENKSKRAFKEFLTTSPSFKKHFSEDLAIKFYYDYRCGILHQAETIGESFIWSVGPLIRVENNKMIINRTRFHNLVKKDFYIYLEKLKNRKNKQIRNNFRRKMDNICGKN